MLQDLVEVAAVERHEAGVVWSGAARDPVARRQRVERAAVDDQRRGPPVEHLEALPHLLKQIVEDHGQKFVRAGFAAFTPTAYEFDLEFDSPTAVFQDMYDARHSIGVSIIKRFQEEGIALVYPAQTGISAADSGVTWPKRKKAHRGPDDKVAPPPSSGDRSVGDQDAPG